MTTPRHRRAAPGPHIGPHLAIAIALAIALSACSKPAQQAPAAEPTATADTQPKTPTQPTAAASAVLPIPSGGVHLESDFSKMIVDERGTVRTLYFVRDSGQQVVESQMNLTAPHELMVRYTRTMFASYLFVPEPRKVLIIGLGAGSMVRFLQRYEPKLHIDAVDIDPVILEVATNYFGTKGNDHVKLIAADGLRYVREVDTSYDVIYMDAFLKPSMSTDETGVPLQMKTVDFYREMQDKLADGGAVVFNLNFHKGIKEDFATIQEAFSNTHLFAVPRSGNYVVVATKGQSSGNAATLRAMAKKVDPRFNREFSVARFIPDLKRDGTLP